MSAGRLHTGAELAGIAVSLIATWPEDAALNDVEEAVKTAARDAIRTARDRIPQQGRRGGTA